MGNSGENIRISVVVPVYNAGRYVVECVRSLMRQTLSKGIEYIFVDDCSTDESLRLIRETVVAYPHRKHQVRILESSVNEGSAKARQRGMDAARGEFVIHCDADDWVEPEMYGNMLGVADTTGADIVCTPYFLETGKKTKVVAFPTLDFPLLNDMPIDTLHCSLCMKLIRRSVVEDAGIRFFEGVNCWEDAGLIFRLVISTQRIVVYNKPFYHYRKEDATSLTTARMDRVLADHLLFVEKMDEWFETRTEERKLYAPFIDFVKFTAKIKMMRGRRRDVERWRSTWPETNRHVMSYRNIPFFYRICFLFADRLPLWLVKALASVF